MKHYINGNTYYVLNDSEEIVFKVELDEEYSNQLVITTPHEIYAGPIDFITFSPTEYVDLEDFK